MYSRRLGGRTAALTADLQSYKDLGLVQPEGGSEVGSLEIPFIPWWGGRKVSLRPLRIESALLTIESGSYA